MKEEKHKLRDKIDIINKEKSELVSQLIRSSLTAELVEDKINQVTTSIEMRLSTEVAGLKAAFQKEIASLKSQLLAQNKIPNVSTQEMQTNTPTKCIDITSTSSSNDNMRSNCTTVLSAVPVSNPDRYVANVHVRDHELSQPTHPSNYTSNRAEHQSHN